MKYAVELAKSVNGVAFGADRECIRKCLGGKYKEFKKNLFSKNTSDAFSDCVVYYTPDNKVDAIEFAQGAEVSISGKVILWEYDFIKNWLFSLDSETIIQADGLTSIPNGVSVFIIDRDVQSILFSVPSYFL